MPVARLSHHGQDLETAYADEGSGFPVLLIHGFASTKEVNWINTGWFKALNAAGFRALAADNRGHGQSTKFHAESDYSLALMAADSIALLDHLGIAKAHVVGYSMGARIACSLAINHGERIAKAVFSGNGWGMVEGTGDWTPVRDALLAPSLADVSDPRGRAFRSFADQTKSDREALAACVASVRQVFSLEELSRIDNEVLVAIGTDDDIAGSGERLAAALPHGEYLPIPGRDHMKAVGDRTHMAGVIEFLQRR
ncbi:MAG: alpha/beta hydrolase [Nitratireductor sp.]|jgi:pimeloyl-ACP methyl ester carboxylesterase|nr:alpha/beta hydrolase [Nitratireductor sp.]